MKSLGQGHRGINPGVQSWRELADPGNQPHKSRGVGDTEEMEGGIGVLREEPNPGTEPRSSIDKRPQESLKEGTFTGPQETITKGSPGGYAVQMTSDLFQEESPPMPPLPNSLILLGK